MPCKMRTLLRLPNIIAEGELDENRTCKKFLQVQTEGTRFVKCQIEH
jgi:hypothetical protein